MRGSTALVALGAAALCACNSLDEPQPVADDQVLVVPTDERPAVRPDTPPPPISGGTLMVVREGDIAVAADPARDRVSIVDLTSALVHHVALEEGDEPGRVIEGATGIAHVALRRAGDVVAIDVVQKTIIGRRAACAAPRGLAFDERASSVHVACAEGVVVTLPEAGGEPTRTITLEPNLRDVIVQGDGLVVSRFKPAAVFELNAIGEVTAKSNLPSVTSEVMVERQTDNHFESFMETRTLQPTVAWRLVKRPGGGWAVLHQRAVTDEVDISRSETSSVTGSVSSSYGGSQGSGSCSGIVQTAITTKDASGGTSTSNSIGSTVLAVDLAYSPSASKLALADAGLADPAAPRPTTVFVVDGEHFDVRIEPTFDMGSGGGRIVSAHNTIRVDRNEGMLVGCESAQPAALGGFAGQTTAVAYSPNGHLVMQTREPASLILPIEPIGSHQPRVIDLGGVSVRDTGHDLFHRDAGTGIACASCHAEGAEDGHVWTFSGIGARRTQALNVGLEGTQPFHWDGDLPGLGSLMDEVFVARMGGVFQSDDRLDALQSWIFGLEPPARIQAADGDAVARGREIFESSAVGCAGCHSGDKLTDSKNHDVGTAAGEALQTPSLVGIGYRAPFVHTGCATSLIDRFDPACGGEQHGNTAQLDTAELDELVAYLESL